MSESGLAWSLIPERDGELVLRSGELSQPLCCAVCGGPAAAPHGLYLAVAGSGEVVCLVCGGEAAPALAAVVELAGAACRVTAAVDRPPLLVPHHDLLPLAFASAHLRLAVCGKGGVP